jgi:hypothetical protein
LFRRPTSLPVGIFHLGLSSLFCCRRSPFVLRADFFDLLVGEMFDADERIVGRADPISLSSLS